VKLDATQSTQVVAGLLAPAVVNVIFPFNREARSMRARFAAKQESCFVLYQATFCRLVLNSAPQ